MCIFVTNVYVHVVQRPGTCCSNTQSILFEYLEHDVRTPATCLSRRSRRTAQRGTAPGLQHALAARTTASLKMCSISVYICLYIYIYIYLFILIHINLFILIYLYQFINLIYVYFAQPINFLIIS